MMSTQGGLERGQVLTDEALFENENNKAVISTPVSNSEAGTTKKQSPFMQEINAALNSVKRKLNQSLSPVGTGKPSGTSSNAKPPTPKRTKSAKQRKQPPNKPNGMPDDNSIVIEDYESEDDEPLSQLVTQHRAKRLLRARKFKNALNRKGTPMKPLAQSKKQQGKELPLPKGEDVGEGSLTMKIPEDAYQTLQKIQTELTALNLSDAERKKQIQDIQTNTNRLTLDMITKVELDSTVKTCLNAMNDRVEKQEVRINQQGEKICHLEEEVSAIQVTMGGQETRNTLLTQKLHTLVNDTDILKAEVQSAFDDVARRIAVMELKQQSPVKLNHKTYAEVFAAPSKPTIPIRDSMDRSIILEGIIENQQEDLDRVIFRLAEEMYLPLNDWELNKVERLGYYNPERQWPRPIRVEFLTARKKKLFLDNKGSLGNTENFYRIKMRQDEERETRIAKAKLRKAAKAARAEGRFVRQYMDEELYIDGVRYTTQNVDELTTQSRVGEEQRDRSTSTRGEFGDLRSYKITPRGLAFFGIQNKLSSFYPCKIRKGDKIFESLEHGYQCDKAADAKDWVRYAAIKSAPTPGIAKRIGSEIPKSAAWDGKKGDVMQWWQVEKYRQNPELLVFLRTTCGYSLIEASPYDMWWGAGVGLYSMELKTGSWKGRNELGHRIECARDQLMIEYPLPPVTHTNGPLGQNNTPPVTTAQSSTKPTGAGDSSGPYRISGLHSAAKVTDHVIPLHTAGGQCGNETLARQKDHTPMLTGEHITENQNGTHSVRL